MSYKLTSITLLAMLLYSFCAGADGPDTPAFSFSGFGTLGLAHSSEDNADFTSSVFKPNGTGHSHNWSTDVDSLIAAQATASLTPELSAVLQVVAEQNYDNTYRPHVEWANIKYQFTPDFFARAGRTLLPVFLVGGTRKVGYTYPWVRPPVELYRLVPINNSDGIDVSYRLHLDRLTNTVQAYFGETQVDLPYNNGAAKARGLHGITYTAELGPLTAHVAYLKTHLTTAAINARFDNFRKFGPQGIEIADKYNSDDKPITFIGVGASYDPGKWFVMGEWGHSNIDSFQGKRTAWYVSSGFQFDTFTPYVTFARATADNLSDPGLTISALPPFLSGPATVLNATLNSTLSMKYVQDTVSFGTRWDLFKNTSLKLQFDHTDIGPGSTGTLSNIQPGFQAGESFNVFSATIDFVF